MYANKKKFNANVKLNSLSTIITLHFYHVRNTYSLILFAE